jgi:hypothetical protein
MAACSSNNSEVLVLRSIVINPSIAASSFRFDTSKVLAILQYLFTYRFDMNHDCVWLNGDIGRVH